MMSLYGQFFNALVILDTGAIEIRFLRGDFDRQINVTQTVDFRLEHAAEENHFCYSAEEIRVLVYPLDPIKELLQSIFSCRACNSFGGRCGCERPSRLGYFPPLAAGAFDETLSQ